MNEIQDFIAAHSPELEQAVLGALLRGGFDEKGLELTGRKLYSEHAEFLDLDCFWQFQNKEIFGAIQQLNEKNSSIDIVSVFAHLKQHSSHIVECAKGMPSIANLKSYILQLNEYKIIRETARAMAEVTGSLDGGSLDALEMMQQVQVKLKKLTEKKVITESNSLNLIRDTYLFSIQPESEKKHSTAAFTGFQNIDDLVTIGASDLLLIAARPAHGKTALALNIARNMAVNEGKAVGFFSLEMSRRELSVRLLSAESSINSRWLNSGTLYDNQQRDLLAATNKLYSVFDTSPIIVDDSSKLTIEDIYRRAERMKARHGIKAVIVDYTQKISPQGKFGTREQEVAQIAVGLKSIAKDLNIPVIALAQLSRAAENRIDKRPQLSDLRESGALEQEANTVILLTNMYKLGVDSYDDGTPTKGTCELQVAKNRSGEVGFLRLNYKAEFTRFENTDGISANDFQHPDIHSPF